MLQKSCSNARQLMYVLNGLPHSFHLSCANSSRGFVIQGSTSRRLMNCGCRRRPQFPCRRRIVFTNIHTHTHTRLFHPVFQSILYTSASIDIHCINVDFGSVLELLDIIRIETDACEWFLDGYHCINRVVFTCPTWLQNRPSL